MQFVSVFVQLATLCDLALCCQSFKFADLFIFFFLKLEPGRGSALTTLWWEVHPQPVQVEVISITAPHVLHALKGPQRGHVILCGFFMESLGGWVNPMGDYSQRAGIQIQV